MSSTDIRFLKGYEMIRSHIGSTKECGVVLKLERFSPIRLVFWGSIVLEVLSYFRDFIELSTKFPIFYSPDPFNPNHVDQFPIKRKK